MTVPRCVLMTADAVGGVWTYALDLARGLTARGTRVVLCVMGPPPSRAQMAAARAIDGVVLECCGKALEWMPDPWAEVAEAGDWLLRMERRYRPDLIHLNGYAHGVLPWRAPVVMVAHSDVLSWFEAVKGMPAPPEFDAYALAVRKGLAAADAVIAPTRSYLETLRRLYGPLPVARPVLNGRDPAAFGAAPPRGHVLAAGRLWDEAKNVAVLASLPGAGVPLRLAGEGEGVPGAVALGRLEPAAMARELAQAAVFAAPARYEPFGLGVLEAALSGCALVLADIPTFRELWDGAALFVRPEDGDGWARACRAALETPERLAGMARQRGARLTAEAMTTSTLAVYDEVLARTPVLVAAE